MSKTRLFVDETLNVDSPLSLRGDQAKYLGRVLRLRPDDRITVFDGSGDEYLATLNTIRKDIVEASIDERLATNAESPLQVTLIQGISRGDRMDFAVQKATELGVTRICPVLTEYSVVKLDGKRAEKKTAHWRNIAISACEQSGRSRLPQIDAPRSLGDLLAEYHNASTTRMVLQPGARGSMRNLEPPDDEIAILVGPEGGFSDTEINNATVAGFAPIGFGPRILRTETAALAAIANLQMLFGDLA